ncbi:MULTISPECIES: metal ABC transporter permease [Deinococcus]|uniref:Manganese transport system permease protein n=2 Tax=Deinococcus soli (ex Cha et al. 2016) TaxID=1309411 RepID=A0ACC6KFC2_9DEIO|nr:MULTISPECIES: metal ABC transporter permease [Deinococcus]MDK2012169.1 metal ABC transporter permease [Deinococcus sp. 43]MDR6218032.1 manganese transport system permease protein [Deinococcus soli (ex Cha et al. 2016)]MDR6328282.1 manganese transport system permease protein [Deinococcus soli (ex Cha et al. 2016)]MDR6751134.1 manganese transport system permease protein [Deinococcus soli (ex Cha et al. 2016)]GGB78993.1 iron ABC transporter permease [Deinococcus soli (ex Cha et al. 2016)]
MDALLSPLLAPLGYDFMLRALLVSALVGAVCAVLSCFITLKGWSLMGDAVSHAVLPGVVLAYLLNLPFVVGAFAFGLLSVGAIGFIQSRSRVKEDTVIGVVFTALFSLGLVMISRVSSDVHLSHILFGDVLGISDADLWQTVIAGAVALGAILLLRRDLLLYVFDATHARSIGLNTGLLYGALLVILALTIVSALQTVGVILVVAMLITPGATAYLLTDRFSRMLILAVTAGVLSSLIGTYASYFLDGATGACIVLTQSVLFGLAFLFAPKHGQLARRRQQQRERQAELNG